jgi:hypothetical protein
LLWCHDQLRLGNVNVTAGIAAVTDFLVANPPPAPADAFLARVVAGEFSMAREAGYVREIATRIGATR